MMSTKTCWSTISPGTFCSRSTRRRTRRSCPLSQSGRRGRSWWPAPPNIIIIIIIILGDQPHREEGEALGESQLCEQPQVVRVVVVGEVDHAVLLTVIQHPTHCKVPLWQIMWVGPFLWHNQTFEIIHFWNSCVNIRIWCVCLKFTLLPPLLALLPFSLWILSA